MYCMVADWAREWIPGPYPNAPQWPYQPQPLPLAPQPPVQIFPVWPLEMLRQFEDLLKRVKELEDKLGGCPCEEPQKLDYLKEIRKMIEGGTASAVPQSVLDVLGSTAIPAINISPAMGTLSGTDTK